MQIDLTRDQIVRLAARYPAGADDAIETLMEAAACRGHMTSGDLIEVARWKWRGGRTRQLCAQNSEADVIEISAASFAAQSERLRIGALLSLSGVQWPMASVILHFAFPGRYPLLDIRAMKTVGGSTLYTFEKWVAYIEICRHAAEKHGITMRVLDKALWVSDKESSSV